MCVYCCVCMYLCMYVDVCVCVCVRVCVRVRVRVRMRVCVCVRVCMFPPCSLHAVKPRHLFDLPINIVVSDDKRCAAMYIPDIDLHIQSYKKQRNLEKIRNAREFTDIVDASPLHCWTGRHPSMGLSDRSAE